MDDEIANFCLGIRGNSRVWYSRVEGGNTRTSRVVASSLVDDDKERVERDDLALHDRSNNRRRHLKTGVLGALVETASAQHIDEDAGSARRNVEARNSSTFGAAKHLIAHGPTHIAAGEASIALQCSPAQADMLDSSLRALSGLALWRSQRPRELHCTALDLNAS